jgi:hypothetical protein
MSRTNWLLVAGLTMLLGACSSPPPDQGNAAGNESALVDNETNPGPEQAHKGLGAFVDPGQMEIDDWTTLEFAVAPDAAVLAEQTEGRKLTPAAAIFVAPVMRVTLLQDPDFEVRPQSEPIQQTGRDQAATWQWKVKPVHGGNGTLVAQVEVGDRRPDGSFAATETYTRRVEVQVHVGSWKGFLSALKNAASLGDVLGALLGSLGKTLTAIAAIITAGPTVWLAIRSWRKRKDAKAAEPAATSPAPAAPKIDEPPKP